MEAMKILQWNLENFFIFLDKYQGQDINKISEDEWQSFTIARERNKSLAKIFGVQEMVINQNPDVCVFSEVGGRESLENFNDLFLNNQYDVFMAPSNSTRGIDIGFLVRKGLSYSCSVKSNRKTVVEMDGKTYKFSRDIPELRFYQEDTLKMVIMGVHLKSKISSEHDYQGMDTRKAEVTGMLQIYHRVKEKYQVPIMIMGDFNGIVQKESFEEEFRKVFETSTLLDYLEFKPDLGEFDRVSYVRTNPYQLQQLDYILIDKDLYANVDYNNSKILRFTTFYDIELPLPKTFAEKKMLPSDHYPQIIKLK